MPDAAMHMSNNNIKYYRTRGARHILAKVLQPSTLRRLFHSFFMMPSHCTLTQSRRKQNKAAFWAICHYHDRRSVERMPGMWDLLLFTEHECNDCDSKSSTSVSTEVPSFPATAATLDASGSACSRFFHCQDTTVVSSLFYILRYTDNIKSHQTSTDNADIQHKLFHGSIPEHLDMEAAAVGNHWQFQVNLTGSDLHEFPVSGLHLAMQELPLAALFVMVAVIAGIVSEPSSASRECLILTAVACWVSAGRVLGSDEVCSPTLGFPLLSLPTMRAMRRPPPAQLKPDWDDGAATVHFDCLCIAAHLAIPQCNI